MFIILAWLSGEDSPFCFNSDLISIVADSSIATTPERASDAVAILYAARSKSFLPHCTEEAIVRKTPKHVSG